MAVRRVSELESTKDGRSWVFEIRLDNKRYKSKKFKTKKEATEAERNFIISKEKVKNQSMMTLNDLFIEHLKFQKGKVKNTTYYNYGTRAKHFDIIKNKLLNDLSINDIEEWKADLNSRGYTTGFKNDLLKYLKCTLNYGSKWLNYDFKSLYNKITNFSDPNELPKEIEIYTYEEFMKFISVEKDLRYRCLFETLYYLGLRKGEARALQWKHVSLQKKQLVIKQNCVNISGDKGKWQITTPKTKSSIRRLPIPNKLLKDLTCLKNEYTKYYNFSDDWFVFGNIEPFRTDSIRVRKNKDAAAAGVKQIKIHQFRHSCASLLINNNANVVLVSKYLGHSTPTETLETYAILFDSKLDDLVCTINNLDINYKK